LLDDGAGDPAAVTRDYRLEIEAPDGGAPLLSVFGGKITTHRRLAEQAMAKLAPYTPGVGGPWTASSPLPGGDIDDADVARFLHETQARYPWLPTRLAARYVNAYGTRTTTLLDGADGVDDLGRDFGAGLFEREVAYLAEAEWARSAEDILWRRSKLGLICPEETASALDDWFAGGAPEQRPAQWRGREPVDIHRRTSISTT
jgi:glycerol-3-phosphate dehydrogenase